MKFGQVEDPSKIDFTLPKDHPRTKEILALNKKDWKISLSDVLNGIKRISKDFILRELRMN
ncbi:Uncharacterised protein [Chryseobacterium gleum]|uniref:Uncharacterized protein n=1 Tax=Chryseobacterium gleum TaxID=250 RepID=A0A448B2J8_CHRGE|nr:Uncharacterised protein [Chryseobacterium gleum]